MKKIFKQLGIASLFAVAMSNAMAVPSSAVTGQWTISFYSDPGLSFTGSQGICFKSDGTWYSTTYSGWNGDWFLKGDRMRWYGDLAISTGTLATSEFGQFGSSGRMSGEYSHFYVPGTPPVSSSRGNYVMTKVSSTCSAAAATAIKSNGNGDPGSPQP